MAFTLKELGLTQMPNPLSHLLGQEYAGSKR